MKTTKILVATLAAVVVFSCAKDNSLEQSLETKEVTLKLATPELTKAPKTQVPTGEKTPVNDAVVFFLNASGQVISGGGVITGTEAIDGKTFTVSASAKSVYVVANNNFQSTKIIDFSGIVEGKMKSDIEVLTAGVETQMGTSAKGVENVMLSGEGTIVEASGVYTCAVPVTPTVCRFEITSISGDAKKGLTSFDLNAIYLTGYYPSFNVGGTATGTIFSNTQVAADLTSVIAEMKDAPLSGFAGANTYSLAAGESWAYFVPVAAAVPHIVFQVSNVIKNESQLIPDPKFVTVTDFKDQGGASITLQRGKVYKVSDVLFDKVEDTPNPKNIQVTVTVTVSEWQVIPVTPVI